MRYIIDSQHYQTNGPILFYSGNEGDIWDFYDSCGFVTQTLAKELNATVIFAEHRYFGQSIPSQSMKHLTIEQTMLDFVQLVQSQRGLDQPVIAVGGSYGGMLAAWLRMKYPHIFQGALAASAPIVMFEGGFEF